MVFACQENSFLKEYKTSVLSCTKAELKRVVNGKQTSVLGYEIVLENTILFPEGGGQPCDYGSLSFTKEGCLCEVPVLQVWRRGSEAVHFAETSVDEGQVVNQRLDWERRYDHMQQHSGQHLISAIVEQQFGCSTVSWWLGEDVSHIELDTPEFCSDKVVQLEKFVNSYIFAGTPVTVNVYTENDPQLARMETRGLPDDHKGDVRVICIEGLDNNMCCGTHVSNLCQLQCIKFVGLEKGKRGHCLLQFLVGDRVLKQMSKMLEREQALTSILNNSPAAHVDLVEKLQKATKTFNKNLQTLIKGMAKDQAAQLKQVQPKPLSYHIHKKEFESDFVNSFIRELNDQDILLFFTIGEEKGPGNMVLHGKPQLVTALGPKLCEVLDGKGAGSGPRFQAKVRNLANRIEAEKIIAKHLNGI